MVQENVDLPPLLRQGNPEGNQVREPQNLDPDAHNSSD